MTKTIIIGEHKDKDSNKPIEFCHYLDSSLEQSSAFVLPPSKFKYIELICKNYNNSGRDLMFAYNDPSNRSDGTLFIGFWNSGTVK